MLSMIIFAGNLRFRRNQISPLLGKTWECRRSSYIRSNKMLALLYLEGLLISQELTAAVHLFLSRF